MSFARKMLEQLKCFVCIKDVFVKYFFFHLDMNPLFIQGKWSGRRSSGMYYSVSFFFWQCHFFAIIVALYFYYFTKVDVAQISTANSKFANNAYLIFFWFAAHPQRFAIFGPNLFYICWFATCGADPRNCGFDLCILFSSTYLLVLFTIV